MHLKIENMLQNCEIKINEGIVLCNKRGEIETIKFSTT